MRSIPQSQDQKVSDGILVAAAKARVSPHLFTYILLLLLLLLLLSSLFLLSVDFFPAIL